MTTFKYGDINYKKNLFEHPELSRIIGEPTTASLITLLAKVRDNVISIQTELRGEADGHLRFVYNQDKF